MPKALSISRSELLRVKNGGEPEAEKLPSVKVFESVSPRGTLPKAFSISMSEILRGKKVVEDQKQACIKVFGAWDPKKVPGNVRNECA